MIKFDGKEKRLSCGVYPDIGLKDEREKRDEARKMTKTKTEHLVTSDKNAI